MSKLSLKSVAPQLESALQRLRSTHSGQPVLSWPEAQQHLCKKASRVLSRVHDARRHNVIPAQIVSWRQEFNEQYPLLRIEDGQLFQSVLDRISKFNSSQYELVSKTALTRAKGQQCSTPLAFAAPTGTSRSARATQAVRVACLEGENE